nr:hypothetical protein [Kibdelosporangium sp. MJ126-NF4]
MGGIGMVTSAALGAAGTSRSPPRCPRAAATLILLTETRTDRTTTGDWKASGVMCLR